MHDAGARGCCLAGRVLPSMASNLLLGQSVFVISSCLEDLVCSAHPSHTTGLKRAYFLTCITIQVQETEAVHISMVQQAVLSTVKVQARLVASPLGSPSWRLVPQLLLVPVLHSQSAGVSRQ